MYMPIVPNFIAIYRTLAELWRFNGFSNGGYPPSWILKTGIFNCRAVEMVSVRDCA